MNYWEYIGSSSARGQVGEKGGFNIIPLQETSEVCIFCWDTNALRILLLIFFSSLLLFSFSTGNLLVKINERRSSRHYIFPDYPTISYTQKHSTPSIFMTHLCDNALSKILCTLHFFLKCVISGNKPMH